MRKPPAIPKSDIDPEYGYKDLTYYSKRLGLLMILMLPYLLWKEIYRNPLRKWFAEYEENRTPKSK